MHLDLFLGDSTPLHATLYARLSGDDSVATGELVGTITGPRCAASRTLPADYALRDLGPGASRLARGVIPDPCYWSSDLPALYDVAVEWRVEGRVRATWRRTTGLKRFGARGADWRYDGRRWVLRAVRREVARGADWDAWREASAACFALGLSEIEGEGASAAGTPLFVHVDATGEERRARLRELAGIPAVLAVVLDGRGLDPAEVFELRRIAPSTPLVAGPETSVADGLPDWADAWLIPAERLLAGDPAAVRWTKPRLAWRPLAETCDVETARAACDALQRDLAPLGDFAGYVV